MKIVTRKRCASCKKIKDIKYFHKTGQRGKSISHSWCKECCKKNHKIYMKTYYPKKKDEFFSMYGEKCSCCGESIKQFLTIEHKLGRHAQVYKDLGKDTLKSYIIAVEDYRPDLYDVLCMNCNHAKGRFKVCPHKWNTNHKLIIQ